MTDFNFDAYLAIPRLSGLTLSPDGKRLVVSVARPAPDGKKMASALWEVDPSGRRPARRLTRSAPGESAGSFMQDGSLLFTSSRPDPERTGDEKEDDVSSLWLLPPDGGEARLLAAPPGGADAVKAARSADVIAFTAAVHPGSDDFAADGEREKARKDAGVQAQLFESFPIRRWDHYLGPRERHLFAAELPASEARIDGPKDLTPEARQGLLETGFDIAPDGATIAIGWERTDDLSSLRTDLVAIDRASGVHRVLTAPDGWYDGAAFSPDGQQLACTRSALGSPEEPTDTTLWLIDLASGEGRDLTPDLDLWPHAPVWSADGAALFLIADRHGVSAAYRFELSTAALTLLSSAESFDSLSPSPEGETLYAMAAGPARPPSIVALDARAAGQAPRVVRSLPELDELELPATAERISATAGDGATIESWLVLPKDRTGPAPLVVFVHGGPLSSWQGWSWRWNPQLLAARGYAVLLPDPALSTGYGQDFIRRGWGRWGAEPYTDVMAAVEGALEREDLDRQRTALMGGSFGGYMANWVAGQTDRFRAIVTHASLWELRGFHGTTDLGPEWEREFGDPYADPSRYEEHSPSRMLASIRTPMLVVHGELDHRVPISEGLRLWTDLQRHGIDSKFLYFPDENHWVLKPQNARIWYATVLAFLDEHVLGKEFARPDLL